MGSVNKVILVGHLGKDPEVRYSPGGQAVANFTVATNDNWTDKAGQKQERTEWHRIKVFGKQAEHCRDYLSKGRQVYIEGRLETRQWDDKEGNKKSTTEVVANQIVFLGGPGGGSGGGSGSGSRGGGGGGGGGETQGSPNSSSGGGPPDGGLEDDDIPF